VRQWGKMRKIGWMDGVSWTMPLSVNCLKVYKSRASPPGAYKAYSPGIIYHTLNRDEFRGARVNVVGDHLFSSGPGRGNPCKTSTAAKIQHHLIRDAARITQQVASENHPSRPYHSPEVNLALLTPLLFPCLPEGEYILGLMGYEPPASRNGFEWSLSLHQCFIGNHVFRSPDHHASFYHGTDARTQRYPFTLKICPPSYPFFSPAKKGKTIV